MKLENKTVIAFLEGGHKVSGFVEKEEDSRVFVLSKEDTLLVFKDKIIFIELPKITQEDIRLLVDKKEIVTYITAYLSDGYEISGVLLKKGDDWFAILHEERVIVFYKNKVSFLKFSLSNDPDDEKENSVEDERDVDFLRSNEEQNDDPFPQNKLSHNSEDYSVGLPLGLLNLNSGVQDDDDDFSVAFKSDGSSSKISFKIEGEDEKAGKRD